MFILEFCFVLCLFELWEVIVILLFFDWFIGVFVVFDVYLDGIIYRDFIFNYVKFVRIIYEGLK